MKRQHVIGGLVFGAAMLALAASASATPLLSGTTIAPSIAPGTAGGTLIADTGFTPFTSNFYSPSPNGSGFAGTLRSEVVLNDPANPFGPGDLTFIYEITSSTLSTDEIERMTVGNFGSVLTDASYSILAGGTTLSDFTRSSNGNVVGFDFHDPNSIPVGGHTQLMIIQTNTNSYNPALATIINSDASQVLSFAPISNSGAITPEPTTALLATPLAALLLKRRRKA